MFVAWGQFTSGFDEDRILINRLPIHGLLSAYTTLESGMGSVTDPSMLNLQKSTDIQPYPGYPTTSVHQSFSTSKFDVTCPRLDMQVIRIDSDWLDIAEPSIAPSV